jgi:hypothetical protein
MILLINMQQMRNIHDIKVRESIFIYIIYHILYIRKFMSYVIIFNLIITDMISISSALMLYAYKL